MQHPSLKKTISFLPGILLVAGWFYWAFFTTGLPSDEEMIAHFQAHRAEFEKIVRRNRTFAERERWPEVVWPREEQSTKELWRRAEIYAVNPLSLLDWLPEPYSLATARRVQVMNDECSNAWKQWHLGGNSCLGVGRGAKTGEEKRRLAMDCQKKHLPPPKCRLHGYQYGVLQLQKKLPNNNASHVHSWRYFAVWKDYQHFPEPPRIENGYLLGPIKTDGTYSYKKRVLSSLNSFPSDWKEYECVYRPIDARWFLCMCNGH
ncbi:MAG: hypothetical protein LBU39_07035 [Desulfobulbaceae bacterium]|jgi:hypothetical protein|nr:hypothetical protein [Desulfobulbaceae bacterium]